MEDHQPGPSLQQGVRELPTLSGGEVPDNVRGQDRISQQKNGNLFKMQKQRRTSAREFAENQVNGNWDSRKWLYTTALLKFSVLILKLFFL